MINNNKKYRAAIILAVIIIAKSFLVIIFPGVRIKDSVEAFFFRQMDILAVMGSNISEEGITTAISKAFSTIRKDKISTATWEELPDN